MNLLLILAVCGGDCLASVIIMFLFPLAEALRDGEDCLVGVLCR
jgi:hypothetical protein